MQESRKSLQQIYEVSCSTVPRKPWIEDDITDINSIFINLELIERQDHRKVEQPEQFSDYTEIFNNEDFKKCKKCVISGDPGSGKTTLASKIAFDWANKKLGLFDYVLVVKLREIANQGGLLCHLRNTYSETGVMSMLESGKHGPVLFILDGLDEMKHFVHSEFRDFLEGKIFPAVHFLITTRPHSLPLLKKYLHITLNVKGFSEEDVEEYIKKYFKGKTPDKASNVIMQCIKDNDLSDLVQSPLCCLMLCFLYESRYADKQDNYAMPNNITELYTELIEVFQDIYERKWGSGNWKDLSKRLGHLAIDMLFAVENGILIFEDQLLQRYGIEPTEACRAGLVTRIESIKGQTSTVPSAVSQSKTLYYSFIHKSLQEFTAALFVLSCTQEECEKLSSQIADLDCDTFCSLDLFIKFTFDVACIQRRDGVIFHDDERNVCSMLLAKSTEFLESQSLDLDHKGDVYAMMSETCIKNKSLTCKILTHDDRFQYLLATFKLKSYFTETGTSSGYHLLLLTLATQDIIEKLVDHGVHINMRDLIDDEEEFKIEEMSALIPFLDSIVLSTANLENIQFKTVVQAHPLIVIDLFRCEFKNQTTLFELLSLIHQCPKLHTFRMCKPIILSEARNPTQSELDTISVCRGNHLLPIKVLELSGCTEPVSSILLQQILLFCTQLTSLAISCDTCHDFQSIFLTLPDSLKVLKLSGSGFTEVDVIALLNHIKNLQNLDFLSICGMLIWITENGKKEMISKDSHDREKAYCDDLRQLSINLTQYCGDLEVIFQTLSKLSDRLDLHLSSHVIDNQMCHNIKSTGSSVVGINMKACRLDNLNPESVRQTWESLKHLKSLDLSMIKDQMGHLDQILGMVPNLLVVLDISGSDISEESLHYLTEFITMKHFRKFGVSGILMQYDKATSYELCISLHESNNLTGQILGHCLSKLNISVLKLNGFYNDSVICTEIVVTLLHASLNPYVLTLSECDIGTESLEDFITYLPAHNLRSITLSQCIARGNNLNILNVLLQKSSNLKALILNRSSLVHCDFISLLPLLSTSLENLGFSNCDLPTNSVQCIMKELCRFTQLRKLDFSINSLEHMQRDYLTLLPTSLEVLDLSQCDLTTDSVQCILKELCRFTQLKELDLSENSLQDVESSFLSLVPAISTSLEVIDFNSCDLTVNSLHCILNELGRFRQLRKLDLSHNSLEDVERDFLSVLPLIPNSLEILNLNNCDLTINSAQYLLKELCRFTQLRELDLSENSLEYPESEFLSLLPSLSISLEVLNLHNCDLTTNSAQCILKELCRLTQLRKLDLSDNSLESLENEFISVLPILPVSLEQLILSSCDLSIDCIQTLMHQLPRLTYLRLLDITFNELTDIDWEGVLVIVRLLHPCSGQVIVMAEGCNISANIARQLENCTLDIQWVF